MTLRGAFWHFLPCIAVAFLLVGAALVGVMLITAAVLAVLPADPRLPAFEWQDEVFVAVFKLTTVSAWSVLLGAFLRRLWRPPPGQSMDRAVEAPPQHSQLIDTALRQCRTERPVHCENR
jgi:hypothetical protein